MGELYCDVAQFLPLHLQSVLLVCVAGSMPACFRDPAVVGFGFLAHSLASAVSEETQLPYGGGRGAHRRTCEVSSQNVVDGATRVARVLSPGFAMFKVQGARGGTTRLELSWSREL